MSYLSDNFPNYDCDEYGNVYKNGKLVTPFKSNKYLQVCVFDVNHVKKVVGVHTVIAMKYLDYYKGCVVHHKNEDTHNNCLNNLEVVSRSKHTSFHAKQNLKFTKHNLGKVAWNKGMKMSEEFCRKCSESAKNRYK